MVDSRATGRRVGRLVGEVDGMGLELTAMLHEVQGAPTEGSTQVAMGTKAYDATERDYLEDALRHVSLLAGSLDDLVSHLNQRDSTRRPGA